MAHTTHQGPVSALTEPERANEIAKQLLSDEKPPPEPVVMPSPPKLSVELKGGVMTPGGLVTEAEVKELDGYDEEALSKADAGTNFGRFMKVLLERGVTRIGDMEPPGTDVLGQLLLGDRDLLVLTIRKATYGKDLEFSTRCVNCDETLDIVLDLDEDVPVKDMKEPDKRRYELELRRGKALVRVPNGTDQEAVMALRDVTVAEMNTVLLSRCVIEVDGAPVGGDPASVQKLPMMDRRTILDFLSDLQPGPKYEEVKVKCASCDRDVPVAIDLALLFRG